MQQFYTQKALQASQPYRNNFNDDAFDLFRIHYPDHFEISKNAYRIIYKDKQKTERSNFNKLGTNYSAYTELINLTLNELINTGEIKDPSAANPFTNEGYQKIIDFLKNNKDFFSKILPDLAKHIKRSSDSGDKSELGADKILTKIFGGDIEIRKTAGLAQRQDTHGGQDRVVIKQGKSYVIQIKSVSKIEQENGLYYIYYLGAKLYPNVDIMIFNKGPWYFAFRAKDVRNISTLQILGDREGYIVDSQHKILITKLES
jgi:hypothetical protein